MFDNLIWSVLKWKKKKKKLNCTYRSDLTFDTKFTRLSMIRDTTLFGLEDGIKRMMVWWDWHKCLVKWLKPNLCFKLWCVCSSSHNNYLVAPTYPFLASSIPKNAIMHSHQSHQLILTNILLKNLSFSIWICLFEENSSF